MAGNNSVWGLLNDLSSKQGITEIIINSPDRIFVEREGGFIQLDVRVSRKDIFEFIEEVAKFNKRTIDKGKPILDGSLPDGSRVNVVLVPFARGCPAVTIRKYLKNIQRFDTSNGVFGLDSFWVTFLKAIVHARMNIIVSGGTGVGKTTFLNMLLAEVHDTERIITIEDTIELDIPHDNSVRLEVINNFSEGETLTARDMVKNTLRMRPDRIVVGEVRGEEIFDLLQAMNVGHEGSMTSIHSSSPSECISRMETLYLLSGYDVPNRVVRKHVSDAVDFIIQLGRTRQGRRIVTHISELTGMEGDTIQMSGIAVFKGDHLTKTGMTPSKMRTLHQRAGLPIEFFAGNA
ncbi:MAG: CpaF family protein [Bacteriovoracaceae bacterium]|nr:CpaF family protein [Bacteriovoracaceae bacterium]